MLFQQISDDYVKAMKAKDATRSSTLSFLRAQLKNRMIECRVETLTDEDVMSVIKKQVKQREDSIAQYTNAGRQDLSNKEAAELEILRAYLPRMMGPDDVASLAQEAIRQTGAGSVKDMGIVMKAALDMAHGRADSRELSAAVKIHLERLSQGTT
jgi:uncharacterized protein